MTEQPYERVTMEQHIEALEWRDKEIIALRRESARLRAEAGQRFDADNEQIVRLQTGRTMLEKALFRTQQERDTLRAALETVHWVSEDDVGIRHTGAKWCPWCRRFEGEGDKLDCQRQAALEQAT